MREGKWPCSPRADGPCIVDRLAGLVASKALRIWASSANSTPEPVTPAGSRLWVLTGLGGSFAAALLGERLNPARAVALAKVGVEEFRRWESVFLGVVVGGRSREPSSGLGMSRMVGLSATTGELVVALPTIVWPCRGCNGDDRCNSDVLTVGCKAA